MRRFTMLVSCVSVFVIGACAQPVEAPVAESATGDADANPFVGTWSLVSFEDANEEGETIYPMGEDAFGRIVYGASGNMAVVLMRRGREGRDAPGFFAYSGSYTLDEAAATVTHHIEACLDPSWIGGDRVRKFERLDGDRIALRPEEGTSELIWQRES